MEEIPMQVKLSGLWVAVMLTYLLGDVLRMYSGDFIPGKDGKEFTKPMFLGIAALMVIPIVMVVVSLTVEQHAVNRWANIVVAVGFFLFNLVGLPTYPSAYDKFLLVVSMGFNVMTVWYAWEWS
jgi:hypothetical protein